MSGWRFFDFDPVTGRREDFHFDPDTGKCTIRTTWDHMDELRSLNREAEIASQGERFGDMRMVARVPAHLATQELMAAIQQKDERYVRRWLNDADHQHFRTFRGKV